MKVAQRVHHEARLKESSTRKWDWPPFSTIRTREPLPSEISAPRCSSSDSMSLLQLSRQNLLIIDELGYGPFSKAGSELLFEVVSRAYENQSLVVTTNLPFEQWPEVCGSERLTGAMLDRLTHRVHIVEANGESYRLRDSQRRMWQRQIGDKHKEVEK